MAISNGIRPAAARRGIFIRAGLLFSLMIFAAMAPSLHGQVPAPHGRATLVPPAPAPGSGEPSIDPAADDPLIEDIFNLDIDQLGTIDVVVPSFDVQVTSVTRTESTVGKSPAAVFVIDQEMIRRSGATTVPELLKLAPGLNVARIDSSKWAISARGFNSRFTNKLLVMIDGRSVYNPIFGGVYWEVQDYPLQDIERIEVIRGPGATLWGENAVNGVINIITKSAADTQGAMVSSIVGDIDEAINSARYGGQADNGAFYRVYARQIERDTGVLSTGAHDDWRFGQAGFRIDQVLDRCTNETLTMQGDIYTSVLGESGRAAF